MRMVLSLRVGSIGVLVLLRHSLAFGLLVLTVLSRARASPSPLALDWQAPAGCPTRLEVQSDVLRLAGPNLVLNRTLLVHALVYVDESRRWVVTLRTNIGDQTGERFVAGESCRAVTDAAVLTLALTLNPGLRPPEVSAAQPPAAQPLAPVPALRSPGAPKANDSVNTPSHGDVRVFAGLRPGAAPAGAVEVGLGTGIALARVQNWVLASLTPVVDVRSRLKPDAGAKYWQGSVADLLCYSLGRSALSLAPCVGVDASTLQGSGYRFDDNRSASLTWFSVLFGADLAWAFRPNWRLTLAGHGLIPLKRPSAVVVSTGPDTLFRPALVGVQTVLGLQLRVW